MLKKYYITLLFVTIASIDLFSQETIFSKDSLNKSNYALTEEQKLLNKYMRNSRRKFSPRSLSMGERMKSRIIAQEIQRRKAEVTRKPNSNDIEIDTTECHHHPKHVLKINTFGVFSGDYVNVNYHKHSVGYYLGLGAVQLTLKTEDNGWWKNGAFSLFVANTHGDNPTAQNTGDLQVFDNIEAPNIRNWKFGNKYSMPNRSFFYEFYYQQIIKNFRILIGESDLNYDFQYSNFSSNLLNSSFGISPEVSVNVPTYSTYPFTSFGLRADYKFKDFFLRAAIAQGNPGDHISNQYNFDFRLDEQHGAFLICELEYEKMITEDVFRTNLRAGVWRHTAKFMNFTDSTYNKGNYGLYFIGEQLLYKEKDDNTQGLGVFLQTGYAPGDYNVINAYLGAGLVYTGLIPKRDSDVLAFGIANPIFNSHLYKSDDYVRVERAWELNYATAINDYVSITPCVQYIENPGFINGENPFVFMIRTSIRGGELYNNR